MARKDLNLSLGRGLLEPTGDRDHTPSDPDAPIQLVARKQKKRSTGQERERTGGRPWAAITTGFIAVTNMLFLLIAGIWLSGYSADFSARAGAAPIEKTPEPGLVLARIENRLDAIEQLLGSLALDKEQPVIVTDTFDIERQLREALDRQETIAAAPVASSAWHINLGNFDSRDAALKLQQRLSAIGHQARIKSTVSAEKTSFLVVLPGFDQRESAELTAKKIMEQTELNSLWVGEGE